MTNLKKCMKKICAVSLAVLMLGGSAVTVLPEVTQRGILASAASEGTTADGFVWQENEGGGVTITYYTGNGGDVVIPSEIDGKTVTEIGGWCMFSGCTGLTSVTIPDTVTEIGEYAFEDCPRLTSINVSADNGYYSSDNGVLLDKGQEELVRCPEGFKGSYEIPNNVTSINWDAFKDCTGLKDVTIPDSVTEIGDYAFLGCTGLTNITIPDSVTSIGNGAFDDCTGLTSVTIPDSVTRISDEAFYGCTGLTSVSIPDSVTEIGSGAFWGCTGLTSVTIPNSVMRIGYAAFEYCSGLTSVTIPDGVTEIGSYAFEDCTGLASVTMGKGVTSIGHYAFSGCTELVSIVVDKNNKVYSSRDGVLFNKNKTALLRYPEGKSGAYRIPDGVKVITFGDLLPSYDPDREYDSDGAFANCRNLTSITIPGSVTEVLRNSFTYCSQLKSVTVENGVKKIDGAFWECNNIEKLNIADSVISVGTDFLNTPWYESQPDGVVYAGKVACGYKGEMPENTNIILKQGTKAIASGTFSECAGLKNITIPDGVVSIEDYAFDDCENLTNIDIPDSVESVGVGAFEDTAWYDLQPDGLIYIGKVAYEYKGEMPENTNITLKQGTKAIADYAFSSCRGLISITIPDSVTSIGYCAFDCCTGLTDITIPDSVEDIETYAFQGCENLINVDMPDSFKSISESAFRGTAYYTEVISSKTENNIAYIGKTAYNCPDLYSGNLKNIVIKDGTVTISSDLFYYDAGADALGIGVIENIIIPRSVINIGDEAIGYIQSHDSGYLYKYDVTIYGYSGTAAELYAYENGLTFIALDNPLTDSKTNITVAGNIGENAQLEITVLSVDDVDVNDDKRACAYYDISLTENGEKIQPNGNVAVKIPYKDGGENIEVYRINDDGTTEKMQSSYDGEYVTFITDHFSKYAIVTDGGIEGDTNNDGEVNIADALMISRYDAGLADLDESQLAVSDVNSDGEVNIADALMISRFDAGLIDKF